MDINRYHCPSFVYQMGDDSISIGGKKQAGISGGSQFPI